MYLLSNYAANTMSKTPHTLFLKNPSIQQVSRDDPLWHYNGDIVCALTIVPTYGLSLFLCLRQVLRVTVWWKFLETPAVLGGWISLPRTRKLSWGKEGQFPFVSFVLSFPLAVLCREVCPVSPCEPVMSHPHTHTYALFPCAEQSPHHFLRENHRFLWWETKVDVSCLLDYRLQKQKRKSAGRTRALP